MPDQREEQDLDPPGHGSMTVEVEAETLAGFRKVARPAAGAQAEWLGSSERFVLSSNEPGQPGENPSVPPPLFIFSSSILL